MKKLLLFVVIILCIVFVPVCADGEFSGVESDEATELLGDSPQEIVENILSGKLELNGTSLIDNFVKMMFSTLKDDIPLIISLLSCSFLLALAENISFIGNMGEMATIGGKIIMASMILAPSIVLIKKAGNTLNSIAKFTALLMPPVSTLLASSGARTTAALLSPSATLISTVLINLISKTVFPLTISGLALSLLSSCIKRLNGVTNLIKTLIAWILGIAFTLFSGIIAIQGAVSSVSDGISIKSLKFAISSSVPIIGGTVSESTSMIISSAHYLKNAGGIMGIIVIFGICFAPLLEILCFYFVLRAVAEIMNVYSNLNPGETVKNSAEYIKLAGIGLLGVTVIWIVFLGFIVGAGASV